MLLEFDNGLQRFLALAALLHHLVGGACHQALRRTKIKELIVRHDFSWLVYRSYLNSHGVVGSISGTPFRSSGILTPSTETYSGDLFILRMWTPTWWRCEPPFAPSTSDIWCHWRAYEPLSRDAGQKQFSSWLFAYNQCSRILRQAAAQQQQSLIGEHGALCWSDAGLVRADLQNLNRSLAMEPPPTMDCWRRAWLDPSCCSLFLGDIVPVSRWRWATACEFHEATKRTSAGCRFSNVYDEVSLDSVPWRSLEKGWAALALRPRPAGMRLYVAPRG